VGTKKNRESIPDKNNSGKKGFVAGKVFRVTIL